MAGGDFPQLILHAMGTVRPMGAARPVPAARQIAIGLRHVAGDGIEPLVPAVMEAGHGLQKGLGIGVGHIASHHPAFTVDSAALPAAAEYFAALARERAEYI